MKNIKQTFTAGAASCLIGISMLPMDASAQSGSRLCGAAVYTPTGAIGLMVEIKQPGKSGRSAANNFCNALAQGVLDGFADEGLDVSENNRGWFKRSECEDTAGWMSAGVNRADICDQMSRTSVGNGANPYMVIYTKRNNTFTVKKP
ncbi:hypothetical protein GH975_06120 [Litorivicinus lipolyticus]|uniref:Uncharacterized protein n=1 Tax=Litorivicinus lipolyticus TaxID=418701 RepID=A0A5Q2QCX8_9GAMM|nr:hypothetical protein [Litorivicinus lipolyticus]QGG80172.1 hypothetical protein GH975_06120 [Litorivicinus lipolyticus]